MKAIITSFRRARHHQKCNQMILLPENVNSREEALKLKDRKVVWKTPSGKEISGVVADAHGKKGAVRARFERGMPGQSITSEVTIQ